MNWLRLKSDLIRHEGLRLQPYHDTEGVLTIGYGRNLKEGISKDEADFLLTNDLRKAAESAERLVPELAELNDARQEVVVNMIFNLGPGRFLKFQKMRAALSRKDYAAAANEMLQSKWASQVGSRATELAKRMRTGDVD